MCNCDLSMIVLLQVQRRMTFTEKNGKKTNMTHTNVNQINDSNMQHVQVLMESSVYALNCSKSYLKYLVIMFTNGSTVQSRNGKHMVSTNVYHDSIMVCSNPFVCACK